MDKVDCFCCAAAGVLPIITVIHKSNSTPEAGRLRFFASLDKRPGNNTGEFLLAVLFIFYGFISVDIPVKVKYYERVGHTPMGEISRLIQVSLIF